MLENGKPEGMRNTNMLDHIEKYWLRVKRTNTQDNGTLIGLPYPYIVPSEENIFQEMYYWDSYFISIGLQGTPHEQLIVDMALNVMSLLQRFGMVPTASRFYFLS